MRVLDPGCGRAASSIFFHREFGVQVWATDLWFSASENLRRIRDAGIADGVFPVHSDARSLPFADDFFDAVVSIDSFPYFGTDDTYLNYIARFVRSSGVLGIAGAGLMQEIDGPVPIISGTGGNRSCGACILPNGGGVTGSAPGSSGGLCGHHVGWMGGLAGVAAGSRAGQLHRDSGSGSRSRELSRHVRVVAQRRPDATLDNLVTSVPARYTQLPLLRTGL